MLQDIILYAVAYLALVYLTANSAVRMFLGRSCQTSSWCLTSVLCLASLAYLARLPLGQLYAAQAVPYVAAIAVVVPIFITASLFVSGRRNAHPS